jgi:prepilin signal peptidase PulO-like enzyme (type II secretory pathway)
MQSLIDVLLFVLGCSIGSFLTVLIDRLPGGKWPTGRSVCDYCGRVLDAAALIPVLSWVIQKGKSLCCGKKLSPWYPITEVATGLVYVLLWRYVVQVMMDPIDMLALYTIVSALIVIVIADLKYHIIPDLMTGVIVLAGVIYVWPGLVLEHVGAGLLDMGILFALYILTRGKGMGFGDVKFAFVIGLLLGMRDGLLALYLAFLLGGLYGIGVLVLKRGGMKSMIAFGPFLVAGLVLMMFWSGDIWRVFSKLIS